MVVTQDFLKEHFEYRDGHLFWVKPTARGVKIDQQFGCYDNYGYRVGSLKGKRYYEHRLIWLYHYGEWPKDQIDHINGDRSDNRIENLRECAHQQNSFNRKSDRGSTSKYKGVHWSKQHKKWVAGYRYKRKRYYVGYYDTELEAAKAYDLTTASIHKNFQRKNYEQ